MINTIYKWFLTTFDWRLHACVKYLSSATYVNENPKFKFVLSPLMHKKKKKNK